MMCVITDLTYLSSFSSFASNKLVVVLVKSLFISGKFWSSFSKLIYLDYNTKKCFTYT